MPIKYVFECRNTECIRKHLASAIMLNTKEQAEELFQYHAGALHFCKYEEMGSESEK